MVMVSLNYVKSEGIMSTVSIRKTTGDDYAAIKAAVDQVIADIGGIEDIIKPGYKVIIKPNLVACPTDRLSGGVTRWEVCLAIYEAVKALGAEPVIAESSAAGADTELTIAKCGYQELRDKGIPVIDLKQKENARCTVEIEDGEVFKKINTWELVRAADANADNTVCIGVCCKKLADAKGFRWVVGCPPGNADVVKGILGDRKEYGVRYS